MTSLNVQQVSVACVADFSLKFHLIFSKWEAINECEEIGIVDRRDVAFFVYSMFIQNHHLISGFRDP